MSSSASSSTLSSAACPTLFSSDGSPWVAGVDGCRAGWVVVLRDRQTGAARARVVPDFAAVLGLPEAPAVIAMDVPIGLPDVALAGGRACDRGARALLSSRASSVFSAPSRAALGCFRAGGGYPEVLAASRRGGDPPIGLSKQTFWILPKIDEVDAALCAGVSAAVFEVHPELCFWEANGRRPLLASKKTGPGREARAALLERIGGPQMLQLIGERPPKGAQVDDLLDAGIACWTAGRLASGEALAVPEGEITDGQGLRMAVWR